MEFFREQKRQSELIEIDAMAFPGDTTIEQPFRLDANR